MSVTITLLLHERHENCFAVVFTSVISSFFVLTKWAITLYLSR